MHPPPISCLESPDSALIPVSELARCTPLEQIEKIFPEARFDQR
jgi:hypothetical protein